MASLGGDLPKIGVSRKVEPSSFLLVQLWRSQMTKPVETLNQIFNRLDGGHHWQGNEITFSMTGLAPTDPRFVDDESSGITNMTETQINIAALVFALWDDLINVQFIQNDNRDAQIAFNYTNYNGLPNAIANTWWSGDGTSPLDGANIWIRNDERFNDEEILKFGSYGAQTYIHEIGHALGLSHPGAYDSSSGDPQYDTDAEYAQDTVQFTVMSYFGASNFRNIDHVDANDRYVEAQTPMLHDVLAIQRIYGADMTTRTDNTVYGFGAKASGTNNTEEFDFGLNTLPVVTIWDAGGIDMLDASGFNGNQKIDLRAGAYSSLANKVAGGTLEINENVAIAYGVVLENARGGSGNDNIFGNAAKNDLNGNDGRDTIKAGSGSDTLRGGTGADWLEGGRDKDKLIGGSGADRFVYTSKNDGGDTISSFSSTDFFVFKGSAFGGLDDGRLKASNFRASKTGVAKDSNDYFLFKTSDDTLWYDADGKGDAKAIKMADLSNDFSVTAADVLIV
jgi:Ca2+-binding RTX toxin-like protein